MRVAGLLLGGGAIAALGLFFGASPASAATLDCRASGQDQTRIEGSAACRAVADPASWAFSRSDGQGVGVADARDRGAAGGVGLFGGVAAAETRGGVLAAVAYGQDSVALGRTESPFAVVLAGPGGKAAVSDADTGAICAGGPALVFSIATGQGCFSDGNSTWTLP